MSIKAFLALEASAGSGKTFALSLRFVSLVLKGAKLNEMLALTFTNKAASEMKERIINTFLHFEEKEAECKELQKTLALSKEELIKLRNMRKSEFLQSELRVQTFDSFFMKMLRAFALNLGLMSDFAIDTTALNAYELFIKNLSPKELESLAYYIVQNDDKEGFLEHLDFLYQNACELNFFNLAYPHQEKQAINKAFREFSAYALKQSTNTHFVKNFDLKLLEDLEGLCNKAVIKNFEKTKYFDDLRTDVDFLRKREALIEALNCYALALENFKLSNLAKLLNSFKETKDKLIKENNALSFSEGTLKAYELIKSEDRDLIYFRLDGKITHLLIDEFQDTSILQYEILKPLIAEIVAGKGTKDDKSFFYVGDKKQSIYGFRNAKKELFDKLRQDFKQIELDKLDTNYRSQKLIVDFVNTVFSRFYPTYVPQKSLENKANGFVRVLQSKEESKDELKQKCLEAILEQIIFLQNKGIKLEEICVLCWKNSDADMIVEFLQDQNIKSFTQSNINLEQKASVYCVLSYAKYCIFGDTFYKLELESLLPDLNLPRLSLNLDQNPSQIVYYLIKRLALDLSDLALIQFLEYARTKENFLELLFEPCPLKILSEQRQGLNVMTVHKSKGLEFKHLILIDNLGKMAIQSDIIYDYDAYNSSFILHFKDFIRPQTKESNYEALIQKKEQNEEENTLNALYVAFTRASESLIIITRNKDFINGNSPSRLSMLELEPCELGELKTLTKIDENLDLALNDELEPFEKVPAQKIMQNNIGLKTEELYFGLAFHLLLEEFDFVNFNLKEHKDRLLQRLSNEYFYFLDELSLEELFTRAESLLNNELFQSLIQGKKLLKEQSLSFGGELKQLDLLALSENEAIIIDYKTGQSAKEAHELQVQSYKKALEQIKGIQTRAFIFYCLENGVFAQEV